jgi:hypothetical protein
MSYDRSYWRCHLALPGAAAISADLSDVVKTRPDQNIDQQYGRDSVYGFSPERKPLKPEQTASRDRQSGSAGEASGFPSANRPMRNDPMDNDAATPVTPSDARAEGMHMGSGYTGQEWTGSTAWNNGSDDLSGGGQAQYEQRALVIFPGTVIAPTASADEDGASSEFVLIVPESSADKDQSAALIEPQEQQID